MSRVTIPETACLAAPAAEHSKPRRRHGSQWRLGHSNSLSPQTPGTHRSPVGAGAPRGHQHSLLPTPNGPSGPGVLGKAPTRAPLQTAPPCRPAGLGVEGPCCSGPQNSRGVRAPVLWSPSQHSVTWDLSSTAIMLDPRDRLPGREKDCDMFLLLLNPLCNSPLFEGITTLIELRPPWWSGLGRWAGDGGAEPLPSLGRA